MQDDCEEGKESQEQAKDEDNYFVYSNWDVDLEEQGQRNLEKKEQKNHDNKTPQPSPKLTSLDTLTLQPPQALHQLVWQPNQCIIRRNSRRH